jgi:hypothetical protein
MLAHFSHSPAIAMSDDETHSSSNASSHTLTLTLNTDGTFNVDDSLNGSVATGNWLWPPGAASSDYAVTATLVSESTFTGTPAHTGTFGSSLNLGTARAWAQTVAGDPADASTLVFDLDFTWNGGAKGHTVRVDLTVG